MRGLCKLSAAALMIQGGALRADEAQDAFVEANVLSILYHELGHGVIDLMRLPVFGQEEDAADVASVLLIDALFEEDDARAIASDAAFGFLGEAEAGEGEVVWSGVHGPDLQRYYNLVCLFVGADIDAREDLAIELELPDERLESCEEEFELAYDSWGPVLDEMEALPRGSIRFEGTGTGFIASLVKSETEALAAEFGLPEPLVIRAEPCGEANAFYDPEAQEITMCTELEAWLRGLEARSR